MVRVHKPSIPGVGSGGPRQGTPGVAYTNRTDLNAGHQPVQVATGQPYGAATQQAQAQKTLPLPTANQPAGGVPAGANGPPPAPMHEPGAMGDFMRPTERPDEPLTHGAPFGPGPGPEALGNPTPGITGSTPISQVYLQLAQQSGNPDLAKLAQRAAQLGQ